MMVDRIEKIIQQLVEVCLKFVKQDEKGRFVFEDPIDKKEISAHYGATHAATAFIIRGMAQGDLEILRTGLNMLDSILERWEASSKLHGYHNDFNNFALCLLIDRCSSHIGNRGEKIKATVISTPDSNNPTVNWYPMRWYVNRCRYEWTGNKIYEDKCLELRKLIAQATYKDGFIDDRTPKGISFNLQYNVATVAAMQLLRVRGEEIDLEKEMGALLCTVAPDGDVNYLGRGTNQIFAWGMWIYLLETSLQGNISQALDFLEKQVFIMIEKENMMLNPWEGSEKYMWWDYHYSSVYTAHFLLWLILAKEDSKKAEINPRKINEGDSGVVVVRDEDAFVTWFEGRKEYLSERGPAIMALWTRKSGIICKGTFGPWQGAFGNKYAPKETTIRNYFGLAIIKAEKENEIIEKVARKLGMLFPKYARELFVPVFAKVNCSICGSKIVLVWENSRKANFLNVPYINSAVITINGKEYSLESLRTMKIRNQYGWINVAQIPIPSRKKLVVEIE